MAGSSVVISDYAAAVAAGAIPGAWADLDGRRAFAFPEVRSENSRGAELRWKLWVGARGPDGEPVSIEDAWLAPGGAPPAGTAGVIVSESCQVGRDGTPGKARAGAKPTLVVSGKNLGRSNATNPVTQALRDGLSRYNSHVRRSGADAARRAEAPGAAAAPGAGAAAAEDAAEIAARPPPMLVQREGQTAKATLKAADFADGVTVQRKFNGVRLAAVPPPSAEAGVTLYSRTGGVYPGLPHIRAALRGVYDVTETPALREPELFERLAGARLTPDQSRGYEAGPYIDGEIYLHGKPLQWISGQARREDDDESLEFMVFDCFFPAAKAAGSEMPSRGRQEYLDLLFREAGRALKNWGADLKHIKRAENFAARDMAHVHELAETFLAEGYEGAIARKDSSGYRYGTNNYHSPDIVKIKPKYDSEFAVVGYTQGTRGKDVGAVIWTCEVPADSPHATGDDRRFNVVPKDMTYEERRRVFACLGEEVPNEPERVAAGGPPTVTRFERDFRGRPLTVEYPEISTKTGKPVQAKALTFRTYEDGVADDPVRRLNRECA